MWDVNEPRRDEVRASAPEAPRHRARKDRKRWCRGKVGVEHTPVWRYSKWGQYRRDRNPEYVMCGWDQRWLRNLSTNTCTRDGKWFYTCSHEWGCSTCGKILNAYPGKLCPEFTPDHEDCWTP